jgi:Flp pilus assembly CpaE family ATPase
LLVDFDFHSSAINLRLQIKPDFTLADALSRTDCLDELWDQLALRWKRFHVLPVPPQDIRLKPEDLSRAPSVFASALKVYRWVLVDLPAGMFSSCQEVLQRAEAVYIVSTPELASLHHAQRKVAMLRALAIPPVAIRLVINRADGRLSPAEIEDMVGVEVTHVLANDYTGVNSAYLKASLVAEKSPLAKQFRDLARRIAGRSRPAGQGAAGTISPGVDAQRLRAGVRGGRWLSRTLAH